eukprot:3151563-Rhodomonas_salina.1
MPRALPLPSSLSLSRSFSFCPAAYFPLHLSFPPSLHPPIHPSIPPSSRSALKVLIRTLHEQPNVMVA